MMLEIGKRPLTIIDIGTNSVLLLVAQKGKGSAIKVLADEASVTRLGEGVAKKGRLNRKVMGRTLKVLKKYASISKKHGAKKIIALGTEALRRARNSKEFIELAKKSCGIDIKIISSKKEAELTYIAAVHDFGRDVFVIDIGGGSTEFISSGQSISIPIGAVTLLEKYLYSDPVTKAEFERLIKSCARTIKKPVCDLIQRKGNHKRLVGVAGTCTTLAAIHLGLEEYSHADVHGYKITLKDIEDIIVHLKDLTIEERKKIRGLEPARADVILPGAVILATLMKLINEDEVTISDHGIRWGMFLAS